MIWSERTGAGGKEEATAPQSGSLGEPVKRLDKLQLELDHTGMLCRSFRRCCSSQSFSAESKKKATSSKAGGRG